MNKSRLVTIIFLSIFIIGCNAEIKTNDKDKFQGLWRLAIIEQQDSISGEWREWRNGLQGYILYDSEDNMAVHLTAKDYQKTDLLFDNFIDTISIEKLKYLTQSYVYFAKYSVDEDEKVIEHARISHSNPNDWNKVVQRHYVFKNDTLVLTTAENSNSPLRVTWIK